MCSFYQSKLPSSKIWASVSNTIKHNKMGGGHGSKMPNSWLATNSKFFMFVKADNYT